MVVGQIDLGDIAIPTHQYECVVVAIPPLVLALYANEDILFQIKVYVFNDGFLDLRIIVADHKSLGIRSDNIEWRLFGAVRITAWLQASNYVLKNEVITVRKHKIFELTLNISYA